MCVCHVDRRLVHDATKRGEWACSPECNGGSRRSMVVVGARETAHGRQCACVRASIDDMDGRWMQVLQSRCRIIIVAVVVTASISGRGRRRDRRPLPATKEITLVRRRRRRRRRSQSGCSDVGARHGLSIAPVICGPHSRPSTLSPLSLLLRSASPCQSRSISCVRSGLVCM